MTQWNFYFSGILYAAFFEGEGELKARLLDPFSGQLGAEKTSSFRGFAAEA